MENKNPNPNPQLTMKGKKITIKSRTPQAQKHFKDMSSIVSSTPKKKIQAARELDQKIEKN